MGEAVKVKGGCDVWRQERNDMDMRTGERAART